MHLIDLSWAEKAKRDMEARAKQVIGERMNGNFKLVAPRLLFSIHLVLWLFLISAMGYLNLSIRVLGRHLPAEGIFCIVFLPFLSMDGDRVLDFLPFLVVGFDAPLAAQSSL